MAVDMRVDTYKLNQYAQRIDAVNTRLLRLDRRLDALYTRVGLLGLWNLLQADVFTAYNWRLLRCRSYLQQTAADLDSAERAILNEDPLQYSGRSASEIVLDLLKTTSGSVSAAFAAAGVAAAADTMFGVVTGTGAGGGEGSSRGVSLSDILNWTDEQLDGAPEWLKKGGAVLIPESVQKGYTLISGLIQGDLTAEEAWGGVKEFLLNDTKLKAIGETLEFFVEDIPEINQEMQETIRQELKEGDLAGVLAAVGEGFTDGVIGGSIHVLGTLAGEGIDDIINDVPIVKGINYAFEYGTSLLGFNEGEGYSLGGLVSAGVDGFVDGLDKATDYIEEFVDTASDVRRSLVNKGISFVKSWFD